MAESTQSLPKGWPSWLTTTDHIGSHYPFYNLSNPNRVSLSIDEIIQDIPQENRCLDLTGVIEMAFGQRLLGNRTLVEGVRRTPWMVNHFEDGFKYHDIPSHGSQTRSVDGVVSALKQALLEEVRDYINQFNNIGILLSGGLDSRVLSGILKEIQLEGEVNDIKSFTWGIKNCRDVEYAKRVTEQYDWSFHHLELSADLLWDNIVRTGEIGAEFAPYHLHALPIVREQADVDAVLAGSYGNSIGRGEYAGDQVTEVGPIVPRRLNRFSILPNEVVSTHRESVYGDAYGYRTRVDRAEQYQYREIEQQLHYMRRGLQSCMTHVAERIPLFQLFTAPTVVQLMWKLDPSERGLDHYKELLNRLPGNLTAIPDPKLGAIDGESTNTEDLAAHAHKYGTWLRDDLRGEIIDVIRGGPLIENLFNRSSVNKLLRIWPHASTTTMNRVDKIISWLASLSFFVKNYQITIPNTNTNITDVINSLIGILHAGSYQTARGFVRK